MTKMSDSLKPDGPIERLPDDHEYWSMSIQDKRRVRISEVDAMAVAGVSLTVIRQVIEERYGVCRATAYNDSTQWQAEHWPGGRQRKHMQSMCKRRLDKAHRLAVRLGKPEVLVAEVRACAELFGLKMTPEETMSDMDARATFVRALCDQIGEFSSEDLDRMYEAITTEKTRRAR